MAIATLGRYRLSSRLPADGTAEVWRAVEVGAGGLERPALVRLWPTGERLGDEVRRSFALSHQNVVAVRDAGELDGRAWVATEWVEGEALGAILQRLGQPLPLRFACLVAVEAARGLDYAGRAGLTHGSLSAARLLVSYEGETKVAGFGWAPATTADVYALGSLLGQMVAGTTVPQGLEAIMARAQEGRYPTCAQMREDLEAFARRESYALSPSDFGLFVRELAQAAEAARAPTVPVKRMSGSRPVASPQAFNLALGGALAALGGSQPEAEPEADAGAGPVAPPPATTAMPQLHAAIAPPPEPKPSTTDLTEMIPRSRPRPALLLGAGALALVAVAGLLVLARRPVAAPAAVPVAAVPPSGPPAGAAPMVPPAAATPPPASAATARPLPAAVKRTVAPPAATRALSAQAPTARHDHDHHQARVANRPNEAHLTILCDVSAEAFVDGQFISSTPIVDLSLPPGRHVVRAVSIAPGLRLIPREQTIELRAGELKELTMVLK